MLRIVDIDDGDAVCAAVQHPEQRGDATKTGAIPDAGRYRNHRYADKPGDNARQGAFHARDDDDHARALQATVFAQDAMDARDADVVQSLNGVPHDLGGHSRLFRDLQIGRAGTRHDDRSLAATDIALNERDGACVLVVRRRRRDLPHRIECIRSGACDEERLPALDNARCDRGDLRRRLAKAEDDFRKSLPELAVRVDARKAEVLKRRLLQRHGDAFCGGRRVNRARANRVEQFLYLQARHDDVFVASSDPVIPV
jgi:hypothetical protein